MEKLEKLPERLLLILRQVAAQLQPLLILRQVEVAATNLR